MQLEPVRNTELYNYRIVQNLGGENFGEFGKLNTIHQYFTPPNSRFTKVVMLAIVNSSTFSPAKTLK